MLLNSSQLTGNFFLWDAGPPSPHTFYEYSQLEMPSVLAEIFAAALLQLIGLIEIA